MYCRICGKARTRRPICRDCVDAGQGRAEWKHCANCGAPIRRRDGLCQGCLDAHLSRVVKAADVLMG